MNERREQHMRRMLAHGEMSRKIQQECRDREARQSAELDSGCRALFELLQRADVQHNTQRKPRIP